MRIHRAAAASVLTVLTLLGVAACGTQSFEDFAKGDWTCRYTDPYDGSASSFSALIGDGTYEFVADDGGAKDEGTWALGAGGVTVIDEYGHEATGGNGLPDNVSNGALALTWAENALDVNINDEQVTLRYADGDTHETVCSKG